MRHRYDTRVLVLHRSPLGEANTNLTLLTPELGLVRARAEGLRKSGAKLAPALTTLAESDLVLVRGKDAWRIAGAVLAENWFVRLETASARMRIARVTGLLLRLVAGETPDPALFPLMKEFLLALATRAEHDHDALEILIALYILVVLGLDPSPLPTPETAFTETQIATVQNARKDYIARINRGITASGL